MPAVHFDSCVDKGEKKQPKQIKHTHTHTHTHTQRPVIFIGQISAVVAAALCEIKKGGTSGALAVLGA